MKSPASMVKIEPVGLRPEGHNTENPVTCDEAVKVLGVSKYRLTALRAHLGIRGRVFMLSPIREFLASPEGRAFTTCSYRNQFASGKDANQWHTIKYRHDGKSWVVTAPGMPDVMASDRGLPKALASAGKQLEAVK